MGSDPGEVAGPGHASSGRSAADQIKWEEVTLVGRCGPPALLQASAKGSRGRAPRPCGQGPGVGGGSCVCTCVVGG